MLLHLKETPSPMWQARLLSQVKGEFHLFQFAFFFKHRSLIPTVLTMILRKYWLKSRFCELIPLIYNWNYRGTRIWWEGCLWRVEKEKYF